MVTLLILRILLTSLWHLPALSYFLVHSNSACQGYLSNWCLFDPLVLENLQTVAHTVSPVSRQVAWKTTPKEPLPTTLSVE